MPTDISGKISIGTKIGETIFCLAQLERLLRHSAPTTPMRILILLLPRRRCATGSSLGPRHGAHLLLSHYIWLPTHICGVCIGSVMTVLTTLHESMLVPPQRCGASLFIACARFCNWQCVACKTCKASLVALAISSPLTSRG